MCTVPVFRERAHVYATRVQRCSHSKLEVVALVVRADALDREHGRRDEKAETLCTDLPVLSLVCICPVFDRDSNGIRDPTTDEWRGFWLSAYASRSRGVVSVWSPDTENGHDPAPVVKPFLQES